MRVWVTRAEPAAQATAERLRRLGHHPLVAPLLTVQALQQPEPDLAHVGALAFTSANAVPFFAALTQRRDLPAYAVGEATALAVRAAGFETVMAGDGDVHALAHSITRDGAPDGIVLHPGAEEPAADLAAILTAMGVAARNLPVYRTEAASDLPATVTAPPEAVLLHSPKAARVLARLVPAAWPPAMAALCLSPACGAPLEGLGFHRLDAARFPNEATLLNLLPHEPG